MERFIAICALFNNQYLENIINMTSDRSLEIRPKMEEAFLNNDLASAQQLAEEYLEIASEHSNWNSGNAIHHANVMLGRIALRNGDTESAKSYLMKAGNTPGSPQLKTFGPNMILAKELLESGEKDAVLNYLKSSTKYWNWLFSWRKLRNWRKEIQRNIIPDFGANLHY